MIRMTLIRNTQNCYRTTHQPFGFAKARLDKNICFRFIGEKVLKYQEWSQVSYPSAPLSTVISDGRFRGWHLKQAFKDSRLGLQYCARYYTDRKRKELCYTFSNLAFTMNYKKYQKQKTFLTILKNSSKQINVSVKE